MEDKMSSKTIEIETQVKKKFKLIPFLKEVKDEMKKVSWTKREELIVSTKIVIGSVFALGLGIYAVDLGVRQTLVGIGNIVRMIVG